MSALQKTLFALAVAVLLFLGGILTGLHKTFPYAAFDPFVQSLKSVAYTAQLPKNNDEIRWKPHALDWDGARSGPAAAEGYGGYTLITTTHDQVARLIDGAGKTVHEWRVSFNALWPDQEHLLKPHHMDDSYFYLRDGHLFPNGDVILMYGVGGLTPWGAGMVRLDKDGKVIWKNAGFYYNDFTLRADGSLYALHHKVRTAPVGHYTNISTPLLEDSIALIGADGRTLDDISIVDAFAASDYANMLRLLTADDEGDYTHTNYIHEIAQDYGVAWARKGNLILSHRNISAFSVLDPRQKKIVYAAYLPLRRQHNILQTSRGSFMSFDNRGNMLGRGFSRVVEFDPVTLGLLWDYAGTRAQGLESMEWGALQELPNGNILIVEAERGHLIEVNRAMQTAWEYATPLRKDGNTAVISSAHRYSAEELEFLK